MSKKLYTDMVSTTGAYIFVTVVGVISGVLFPRLLGPDEWGLWAITVGLVGILGPIAQLAMSTTIVTYISKYKKDKKKVTSLVNSAYVVAIIASFTVSVSLILLSDYLAGSVFGDVRLRTFFLLGAGIIFLDQLNIINRDYFRGFKNFKMYNALKIIPTLSLFLLTLSLIVLFSYRAIHLVISQVIVFSITCILVLVYLFRYESTFKQFKIPRKKETVMILKFGIPLIFAMTFITIMKSIDRMLIGYFLGTIDVGIYSVASVIPLMLASVLAPISIVLLPTFSERKVEGISSSTLLNEILSLLLYISIPLIIFIHIFSEDILLIVYGTEYTIGALVLSIASFEILLFGGYILFRTSVQAAEKTVKMALGIGGVAGTNIVLNVILIPRIGIEGAALGTVFSFVLLFFFMIYEVKNNYNLDISKIDANFLTLLALSLLISGFLIHRFFSGFYSFTLALITFIGIWSLFVHISSPRWYKEMMGYIRDLF